METIVPTALLPGPGSSAGTQFLNFYGPPRTVETVSYSDALRAARANDSSVAVGDTRFKGKAVFIGYAAATAGGQDRLRDDYRTVFSQANGLDLSGVEIAATAFANLVDKRALRPLGIAQQLCIVVAWGLVLGVVCRRVRPVFAAVIVAALAAGYAAVAQHSFAEAALWLPLMTPVALQAPAALFAGVWLNFRDTKREREAIKHAFGFFLPRSVVDQLARNLGPLPDANRVVFGACLATDVEKYTTLAETTEPARLGELMNDYYAELFVPVERSSGVIADVVGDSMMAVWVRSAKGPDVRRSACLAALEIAAAVERFNAAGSGRPALPTRFGLTSGEMLFGTVGASGHYEYRAVGDIVNTASRIQGLNKVLGTRLLASEETVRGLDDIVARPLGSFLLVGKAKPVSIVELLGLRDALDQRPSRTLRAVRVRPRGIHVSSMGRRGSGLHRVAEEPSRRRRCSLLRRAMRTPRRRTRCGGLESGHPDQHQVTTGSHPNERFADARPRCKLFQRSTWLRFGEVRESTRKETPAIVRGTHGSWEREEADSRLVSLGLSGSDRVLWSRGCSPGSARQLRVHPEGKGPTRRAAGRCRA